MDYGLVQGWGFKIERRRARGGLRYRAFSFYVISHVTMK